ncbi:MAG: GNAT family N-acetyltransferase [Aureliella sp.]
MAETIEPFDQQKHMRVNFDCGVPSLNEWLKTKVTQFQKRDLSRTYVLVEHPNAIVRGYYAISSHTISYAALPKDQARGLPQIDLPVVLIGRLAVDLSAQGMRLGEFLLLDALRRAEKLAKKIGIRAVEVDALDARAKQFYQKYGFMSLVDDPQNLFLPMHMIRQLKLPPL